MDSHSDNVDQIHIDSDKDLADTLGKFRPRPRPTTELPQTFSTKGIKANLQESFSTQVLEYYAHSAGPEIVSQALGPQSIIPEATTSVRHGSGQQAVGLGPQLRLDYEGLGSGLSVESEDIQHKLLPFEPGDLQSWDDLGMGISRLSPITSDEIIALPRKNIPKHVSVLPPCSDNLELGQGLNVPRERKKWVKPPLFEHSSGSDETFDGHLFSEQNSIDYQRNFASKHISQRTGEKYQSKTLDLGLAIPHQTLGRNIPNSEEISSNVPNITITEDRTLLEHEVSNESRPKSPLDVSLDASGLRASSPSSSIASNKRGLEWDSGADVGYHYHAKDGAQVPQISTFERIALARGSRAYQLTSDLKTFLMTNSQSPTVGLQRTELSQNLEHPQVIKTQKGSEFAKKYKGGNVQTFPPKHVSDVKSYVPLSNTLSELELYKLVSVEVSSKVTPSPQLVREALSTETSEEKRTLKQDSHEEYESLQGPLAQSTPLEFKERKTNTCLEVETRQRQVKQGDGQNENQGSSYFPKKLNHFSNEISFIPQEIDGIEKMSDPPVDLHESSNGKEQSKRKENVLSTSRPTSLLLDKNLQTLDNPTAQKASDENAHGRNTRKLTETVFCVDEIEELIKNIQRKANEHQEHIDKFVKQTHFKQIIPHTFPRTRREESLSRDTSTRDWAQSRDQEDPITNNATSHQTCSVDCRGAHKKKSNRSETTNSPSPCISPHLNEDGSCSSVSSCYFSDNPQSGNIANERGTVGSAGSFEYLPGHVYEKTNIKNSDAQSKVQVQRRTGPYIQSCKHHSLQEDLKIWAQLCQDNVIKTKEVVNQIVDTNYLEDEDEKSEIPLQTGCSDSESVQSDKPADTEQLSAGNLMAKYCDKGTQIVTVSSSASSDVESNTSSRRTSLYKKEEETSDRTCEATEDSRSTSSCKHGRAKGSSSATCSTAGYNTSTSRSFSNCESGDWRKPVTQSEQEFESQNLSNKKHKSKHAGTQSERLAIIDQKINHLNNLKMILERQDKLKKSLTKDSVGLKVDSVPLPKHRSVYTVMTATVRQQSEENVKNETAVKELDKPSEHDIPSGNILEGQSDSAINWSSHHNLISQNTRDIATQVPSSVSLNVLKEQTANASTITLKHPKEDLVENKINEGKREICTQTPSTFNVATSSDADSIDQRTNQGRINVYVQTLEEKEENKKTVGINGTEQLCCCQCEGNLLIIKEKASSLNAQQSYSINSCPGSCRCKCHKCKSSSLPNGHNLKYVPISVSKSPELHETNMVPVTVTCNCKKLHTSTPITSSCSVCKGSTHHTHHTAVVKHSTLQRVQYQTPIMPMSHSLATQKPPAETPRNATRNTATSTVDNKGVQTSDSVSQLPIIRPLWFSTSNSHLKIRGKKCVCCSNQPVKKSSHDSKVIFEENCLPQKSSKYKSSSCSDDVRCPHKSSYKSSSRSADVRCPHRRESSTYKSGSLCEDVRCPHNSSTSKSGSRSYVVRCPHIASTYKSSSTQAEDVMLRCEKCRKDIRICHCKYVKTSTNTDASDDSWDISAVHASTGPLAESKKSVATPRSIGYLLTFETVSAEQSSSSETVRKPSLQEVKVKIPVAKPKSGHKSHGTTHHEKDKSKPIDTLPQKNSLREVRAQIPSRRLHVNREEKPTEILNSNGLAGSLGENISKRNSLEEVAVILTPEKKNGRNRSHSSRPTLQDYLRQARPDYIKMAEARRRCLAELADLRVMRRENRQRLIALASGPGSSVDTDTLSSAVSMLPPPPMAIKRVFKQKMMRKQTEKGYQKCPEVLSKKVDRKRKEDYRTNRLMAEIFTKKLQKKTLRGDVNLSNSVSVISIL